jgi:hypothetical protein
MGGNASASLRLLSKAGQAESSVSAFQAVEGPRADKPFLPSSFKPSAHKHSECESGLSLLPHCTAERLGSSLKRRYLRANGHRKG